MKLLKHLIFASGLFASVSWAQTIPNPSFEVNTFTGFPGYVSSNTTITGWTASPANRVGLNPSGGSPFADNGAIPNGTKVAFVQSTGGGSTLATTITGLTPGAPYRVSFRANSRSQVVAPNPSWSVNGAEFVPFTASPIVGGSNPYYTNAVLFTATGPTASLIISNQTAGDSTVLLDDFSISSLATVVVSNTANSGPGSLRDAIAAAPVGAIIGFAPALSGATITLASEIVVNNNNIAITASSLPAGITITGGNATRLFFVNFGRTVSLRGLTLTGGNGSGATSPGYGGAIQSQGNLWLTQCTLFSNSVPVQAGGAINNTSSGNLTLMQCTFAGNFAEFGGGAIFNEGPSLTLTNCTFATNRVRLIGGGAVLSTGITVAMGACLFSGNIRNGNPGADFFLQSGAITAANCLLSDGANSGVANNVNGNLVGTSGAPINALLSPLGNYGGGTPTLLPMPGSPAIDKGIVVAGLTNDQRGFPRLRGAAPDIGAVEFNNPVVTISGNSGAGSLRQVISNSLVADYITFAPGLSGGSITLSNEIVLTNSLTIDGSSLPAGLTVSGGNVSRIFSVASGQTVFVSDLRFTGGNGVGTTANGNGGAILNRGALTLTRCTLLGNSSGIAGGAIDNSSLGSVLTLMNCTLSGNRASTFGGAINSSSGTLMFTNCTLAENSAAAGGGIFSQGGPLALTHCTVAGNYASGFGGGGGFYVPSSTSLIANNTIIAGNAAAQGVGPDARIESSPALTVTGCLIGNALDSGITAANGNRINLDARLAPLANHGGPTLTLLPLPGSPAIDAATNSTATTDQRGFARPLDGDNNGIAVADIGAVESVVQFVTTTADSGNGSLRQVVSNVPNGGVIGFAPNLSGATLMGKSKLVEERVVDLGHHPVAAANQALHRWAVTEGGDESGLTLAQFNGALGHAAFERGLFCLQLRITLRHTSSHLVKCSGQFAEFIVAPKRRPGGNISRAHLLCRARQISEWMSDLSAQDDGEESQYQRERNKPRPQNPLRRLERLLLQQLPRHRREEEPLRSGQSRDRVVTSAAFIIAPEISFSTGFHRIIKTHQVRLAAVLHPKQTFAGQDFFELGRGPDDSSVGAENDVPRAG